jgi:Tol biopolymer transport system component
MLSIDGDRQAKPLLRTEFNEAQASISPDGRWLSYTSDESGHPESVRAAFQVSRR